MNNKVIAIADCNNFYASCERVFNPKLNNKPVVVLSNNDGCVIARSQEAKDLNIPMGLPAFKGKELFKKHKVEVLSSNYPLYGSMSKRVIRTLIHFVPDVEVYSIDESFLDLTSLKFKDPEKYCRRLKATVCKWTGIPISIGIASTKTLSKAANKIAKNDMKLRGVLDFTKLNNAETDQYLKKVKVSDVWGVGRQYSKKLKQHGIYTAFDLKNADLSWIRKKMTVQGQRTVLELRGESSIPIKLSSDPQKAICSSKSFGRRVKKLSELEEAVSEYASRAAEKLRKDKQLTQTIQVFVETSRFLDKGRYFNSIMIKLPTATSATSHIIKEAVKGIKKIYKYGYEYKKCGIILLELSPEKGYQYDMFRDQITPNYSKDCRITRIMDNLNQRWGKDTVMLASQGIEKEWQMNQEHVSNRYTTVWSELIEVNLT